jgi:hypothetical protein
LRGFSVTRCEHCAEWVDDSAKLEIEPFASTAMHTECLIYKTRGSAAHQLRALSMREIFADAPAGLSKREVAAVAYDVFKMLITAQDITVRARAAARGKGD